MATILTSQYGVRQDTLFVVFDIEALGDVNAPENCRIWNLAGGVLGNPTDNIDLYIQPAIEPFPTGDFSNITKEELEARGATTIQAAFQEFMTWVNQKKQNPDTLTILMSHGCFRYDKILLEHELMRNGLHFPPNLFFFDTLHWTRQALRGRVSYTLSDIYSDIFNTPIDNAHWAHGDALALNHVACSLMNSGNLLTGVMYPPFFTPIVRIAGIGICSERILVNKCVRCVEELSVMYSQVFAKNDDLFVEHLCYLGLPADSARCVLTHLLKKKREHAGFGVKGVSTR